VAATDARIAYLLSASAVAYLVDQSGEHGLIIFLERWRDEQDFEAAFRAVYGRTMGQFESDWRRHVKPPTAGASSWATPCSSGSSPPSFSWSSSPSAAAGTGSGWNAPPTELPDDPAYWLENRNRAAGNRKAGSLPGGNRAFVRSGEADDLGGATLQASLLI
jgi:hypothetical protein